MIVYPNDRTEEFGKLRKVKKADKVQSTGYLELDPLIQLAKKYLMIVTGFPSSGKSEVVDAILVNMQIIHGWKTLFFSPENKPTEEHMAKLAEKYIGKPMNKFSEKDTAVALAWLHENFSWTDFEHEPTLDELIADAKEKILKGEIDCFVIDPWNAMTHDHKHYRSDTYLGMELSKLIRFARKANVLVIVVAHPKTPQKDKNGNYPEADMYCITDGVMWRNKADYGVVVMRRDHSKHVVIISIQKIKFKWMGMVGHVEFDYDPLSGRFRSQKDDKFELPTREVALPVFEAEGPVSDAEPPPF